MSQLVVSQTEAQTDVPGFSALSNQNQVDLVNAATSALNAVTGRVLPLTTHVQTLRAEQRRRLKLAQYPVWDINRIAIGWGYVLQVQCVSTAVPRASMALATTGVDTTLSVTGLTLSRVVNGAAVVDNGGQPLSFATYPTVGALAAAINGLGNGWTATVQGITPQPSLWATNDIHPEIGTRGCLINAASLYAFQTDLVLYEMDPRKGVVFLHQDLPLEYDFPSMIWAVNGRYGEVMTSYQAGYNNDSSVGPITMPDSLKRAAHITIQALIQRTAAGNFTSERTSLQQYTLDAQGILATCRDLWINERRRVFA